MRFDLWLPTANPFTTPELLAVVGREAEERGIDRIWVGEHVVLFDEYASSYPYAQDERIPIPGDTGLLDPFVTLSFLAAHTSSVRLGTAMCLLPQRNPVYTAKEVATLDWLSGGRIDLGVGVGWLREEFEALGVPWAERGRRTDEYLMVLRSLWEEDPSSFEGDLVALPACRQHPKPLQQPLPVHIGGESEAAIARVARLGNGWVPFNCMPDRLAGLVARLDRVLAEQGRARQEIDITASPYFQAITTDQVAEYADAGADALALMLFAFGADEVPAALDALVPLMERAKGL